MNKKGNYHHIYEKCKDHMHAYVLINIVDGTKVDGIITGLDEENVYLAIVPESTADSRVIQDEEMYRQFGYGSGYGSGYGLGSGPGYGYGGYPGYNYNQGYNYPPQRFRRLVLPLTAIAALSLLPWY